MRATGDGRMKTENDSGFKLSRRDLLKWGAGGLIAARVLRRPMSDAFAVDPPVAEWGSGEEKWVSTTCLLCPGACGLRARWVDGRVVKLEGNPLSPVNEGRLCPRGFAGIHTTYHPDRLGTALHRTRGSSGTAWETGSTDEALKAIAGKIAELVAQKRAQEIVWVDGGAPRRLSGHLARKWLAALGSPHYYADPLFAGMQTAFYFQQGQTRRLNYDFENAQVVLSFGASLLEGGDSPVHFQRVFGKKHGAVKTDSQTLIQVEPRFSTTAAKADVWVPIRSGTYRTFALGVAYVLLNEGLIDRDFLAQFADGFEDWTDGAGKRHAGFKSFILENYRLDAVSTVTGVPVETIVSVARQFWTNRPGVAVADWNATLTDEGPATALAVHTLNALVGSIGQPGGVIVPQDSPLSTFVFGPGAPEDPGELFWDGREHGFQWLFTGAAPPSEPRPPISLLFLHGVNPHYYGGFSEDFVTALSQIPTVVAVANFPNETDLLADWVLPEASHLEQWDLVEVQASQHQTIQVVQPVLDPPPGAVSVGDFVLKMANAGGPAADPVLRASSMADAVSNALAALKNAGRGMVFDLPDQQNFVRQMEERGWWSGSILPDSLPDAVGEKGGWEDPYHPFGERGRTFLTKSHRFEFRAPMPESAPEVAGAAAPAEFALLGLPAGPPSRGNPGGLDLAFFYPLAHWGMFAPLPYLVELYHGASPVRWDSWVEMNPEDAAKLGVKSGERVEVTQGAQKVTARAVLLDSVPRGHAAMPLGLGHRAGGRFAEGVGVNPLTLLGSRSSRFTGLPSWGPLTVRIAPVQEGGK